jgi:hypothetical protein
MKTGGDLYDAVIQIEENTASRRMLWHQNIAYMRCA